MCSSDLSQIDYVEGLMRSGFVISNPNYQGGGGCGSGGCACGGGGGGVAARAPPKPGMLSRLIMFIPSCYSSVAGGAETRTTHLDLFIFIGE